MHRSKITWSPVELDYLKKHKNDDKNQLCIALGKSRGALDKKLRELNGTSKTTNKIAKGRQSRVGKRKDLKMFLRSSWEANFMRVLLSKKTAYSFLEYEPKIFSFTEWVAPKGMALSYTPDFLVEGPKKEKFWVEVKGNWLRSHDKTKLKRFKKFYPDDFKNLIAVVSSKNTQTAQFFIELGLPESNVLEYLKLKKEFKDSIPGWEE